MGYLFQDAVILYSSQVMGMCLPAQSGDAECMAAWQRICAASRREFEAIYSRLGVTLTERGESFYNPMLKGEGAAGPHPGSWHTQAASCSCVPCMKGCLSCMNGGSGCLWTW